MGLPWHRNSNNSLQRHRVHSTGRMGLGWRMKSANLVPISCIMLAASRYTGAWGGVQRRISKVKKSVRINILVRPILINTLFNGCMVVISDQVLAMSTPWRIKFHDLRAVSVRGISPVICPFGLVYLICA